MSGHWICACCGYDGEHAKWCRCLRPPAERWKGHRTEQEMKELERLTAPVEHKPVTSK